MTPESDKTHLLHQLRIAPADREETGAGQRKWWLSGGIAVIVIGAAAAILLTRNSAIEVSEATAVAASAASAPTAILQATGYVTAEREATVSSQIAGQVVHVYFQEGEHVHRGQVLARLDDSSQRAALDQVNAQLAAAQAQLHQYQVQLAQARRDFARDQALIGQHLVSSRNSSPRGLRRPRWPRRSRLSSAPSPSHAQACTRRRSRRITRSSRRRLRAW
jgi:multidrug efflux pump subunit AcrA (membrane-fusion protein)